MAFFRRTIREQMTEGETPVSHRTLHASAKRGTRRRRTAPHRRLSLENLEERQLLAVVTMNPVKDNTLIENISGARSNGAGDVFVGLNNDGNRIRRGLLDFDVARSVPAGATINSVTLTMYVNRTRVGNRTIGLHKVLTDWGEANSAGDGPGGNAQPGDATWLHTFSNNQFWATPGGDFSPTASGSQSIGGSGASYSWNSTSQMVADVQSWLDNPSTDFGWLLLGDEGQRSSKRFDSSESSNAARRPTLTIDYTEAATAPDISISDVTVAEGNSGVTNAVFNVTLSAASTQTVTVSYATVNGTAAAGADFQATNGTLTFAPGQTSRTVTVPVTGDATVELKESFQVTLNNAQNATILDGLGVGSITNDDSATLSINDVTRAEGNSGTTNFVFTVTLDKAVDVPVSVFFSTADQTATTAGGDYTATAGTLNFTGSTGETKTVTVAVTGDAAFETDETFLVDLANIVAAGRDVTWADGQGLGTITNDDTTTLPTIAVSDATLAEGNSGTASAQFNVTLSEPTAATVTVDYATADGTAAAGADYQAATGTLTFAPGETAKTVTVTVNGDTVVELDESFLVNLTGAQHAVIQDPQGAAMITNDDAAAVSIGDVTRAEGDAGVTSFDFTVTLNGGVDVPVTVDFSTADGTANTLGNDYTAATGTLTFSGAAGQTQTATVNVTGDQQAEFDETFLVNLLNVAASGRNVTVSDGQGLGMITNDDAALTAVTVTPVKDNTLVQDAAGAISNGAGDIYVGQNANGNLIRRGLLAFDVAGAVPAGATIESVTLTMYVSATQTGDGPVELHKVLADWGEAGSSGKGTGAPAQPGDATWLHTAYDTEFWSNAGGDFSPAASAVQRIGAANAAYTWGSTPQLVSDVQSWLDNPGANFGWLLSGDETQNSAKQFESRESADAAQRPSITIGYSLAPPPEISIGDATVTEGNSGITNAEFVVTLSSPSSDPVTVDFSTVDQTASAGSDYQTATGAVTFAPGQTTQTAVVQVNGDAEVEADETFLVNLYNAAGATIADSQGQGTILNDDSATELPTLTISDVTRQEGNNGTTDFVFTVTLNGSAGGPVTVDFTTADGTAVATNGGVGDEHDSDREDGDQEDGDQEDGDQEDGDQEDGDREDGDREDGDREDGDREDGDREDGDREDGGGEGEFTTTGPFAGSSGDYLATSGTLHFSGNAGETMTITVSVQGDKDVELDEEFFVNLSNAVGATIADGQGVGVIRNDDAGETGHGKRWQNPRDHLDVSDDAQVTALDALTLINYINSRRGEASLPVDMEFKPPYYDVSGDDFVTAHDVLMVINRLNQRPANGGEGEQDSTMPVGTQRTAARESAWLSEEPNRSPRDQEEATEEDMAGRLQRSQSEQAKTSQGRDGEDRDGEADDDQSAVSAVDELWAGDFAWDETEDLISNLVSNVNNAWQRP